MSVEDRLRSELHREADSWTPAVESSLSRVRTRRRRGQWAAGTAAAAVLVVVATSAGLIGTAQRSGPPAGPTSAVAESLVGRYAGKVDHPARLAGGWALRFRPDSRVDVEAPAGYQGVLSAVLYRTDGDRLTTTLFQEDVCSGAGVGSYTWNRTATGVRFRTSNDTCTAREQFLTETSWASTP